jgi:hypothetical protein
MWSAMLTAPLQQCGMAAKEGLESPELEEEADVREG